MKIFEKFKTKMPPYASKCSNVPLNIFISKVNNLSSVKITRFFSKKTDLMPGQFALINVMSGGGSRGFSL